MEWIAPIAGTLLILVGLNDVFHTLFYPSGRGRLSAYLVKGPWRLSQRLRGRPGGVTGPIGIVLVILFWMLTQAVGWALVYLPQVPDGFSYSPGIDPTRYADFAEALYISLVTLATLGFGDVVASSPILRLLSPLQALTGFILFTAAVSWLMQLYPALGRRRAVALRLTLLRRAGYAEAMSPTDPSTAALLHDLAGQIAQVRVDLGQSAETYYFGETDSATCLPPALKYARELGDRARQSSSGSIAAGGAALGNAVDDLAALLRTQFIPRAAEGTGSILEAAVADHGCDRHP